MSIIKVDYGEVGGGGGEFINKALTGTAPNFSGTLDINDGYVHVTTPNRYYTTFAVFKIENGVINQSESYISSSNSYTYNNGVLTVNLTDCTAAYGTPYFRGYKTK